MIKKYPIIITTIVSGLGIVSYTYDYFEKGSLTPLRWAVGTLFLVAFVLNVFTLSRAKR